MQVLLRPVCRAAIWLITSKRLLAMRLTVILLTVAVLQVSAKAYTQTVTISLKNASLEKVFAEIKKQTGYSFLYTDQMLEGTGKIDINVKSATLEQVLNICLKDQPLSYTIVNKTVVLKPKDTKSPNADGAGHSGLDPESSRPSIDISGKVTDSDGNPLRGASVKVKDSDKGTTTNKEGVFVLKGVDNDATLEISFVGYQPYTLPLSSAGGGGRPAAGGGLGTIALKLNVITNPEVIINKGLYTEKQRTSVSNVVKITAAEIERQPVQNVVLALQARVPGLFVTQGSGNAGSSVKVRIQGQNSIANGSDPLYVVDGMPIDAQLPRTGNDWMLGIGGAGSFKGWGSPLNYLNPLDIESVEVLKDADATAIYGSRAANGAILITTKKGKVGSMRLDLNMETGWGRMTRRVDMMNTRQYLDMRYEAFANDKINWRDPSVSANDLKVWDTTRYTNWQDELLGRTAKYNNINASVSGGSANVRYLVSGTYHKETTVFPLPSDFADQNAAVHFNLNANNNSQKLRMQFSGNYMFDDNEMPQNDFTQTALLMEPDAPSLLNADGSINWAPDAKGNTTFGYANVMVEKYRKYINRTHNLVSSLKLDYAILPRLNIGSSFGYNYMQTNDFLPSPLITAAPENRATTQRSAVFGDRNLQSWIIEPQVSYQTKIKRGTVDLLIGSTFQNKKVLSNPLQAFGQLSDELLNNINAAATIQKGSNGSTSNYWYNALFGRTSYNWNDKYILSINARRDGSTRFGADHRFQNFGSIGGAWIFSNESFFKSNFDFISFGKLRGSYGTTGSDQIGDYQYMSLYNYTVASEPYQGIVGLYPSGLPNPELEWEETHKLQLGIDIGFLADKLVLNANYIRNRSSNQLLNYTLPNPAGFTSYLVNFPATIQNRNWEFIVAGKIIQKKNLSWSGSINLTIPQNKLIEFPGLTSSTYANQLVIGEPIDINKLYHWIGVATGTGDYLYADNNGHLTLSPDADKDRNAWISKFPKFYGGLQNSISYKSIQLDFIFQFVKQNGYNDVAVWNGFFRYSGMFAAGASNQPVTLLDRWQQPGDHATVARYSTYAVPYVVDSDRRFANASYISLKNVSLSWELTQKWITKTHFRDFHIYLHCQNLLMLTNYKGLNPETQSMNSLPPLQLLTTGVQLGL